MYKWLISKDGFLNFSSWKNTISDAVDIIKTELT